MGCCGFLSWPAAASTATKPPRLDPIEHHIRGRQHGDLRVELLQHSRDGQCGKPRLIEIGVQKPDPVLGEPLRKEARFRGVR